MDSGGALASISPPPDRNFTALANEHRTYRHTAPFHCEYHNRPCFRRAAAPAASLSVDTYKTGYSIN
jgi:hypothetical protein